MAPCSLRCIVEVQDAGSGQAEPPETPGLHIYCSLHVKSWSSFHYEQGYQADDVLAAFLTTGCIQRRAGV